MDCKIEVRVELKKGALDAEGETVCKSLGLLGYNVKKVDSIKIYKVTVDAKDEKEALEKAEEMSRRLLANPVIQEYKISVV